VNPSEPLPSPIVLPPLKIGDLQLASRYLLSPLAGFTNLPFRRVVREVGGVGLCTTDLVNARALLEGTSKSLELIATCPADTPLAVQIFGSVPDEMAAAAVMLEQRGVHSIDINMGCPVSRITKGGAGAGMLCRPDETVRLVERVVQSVRIPVTVKMRLGWDDENITAPEFARAFEQIGVAAVAIHGRTRAQGFSGVVNRDGIRRVVEAVKSIPVVGNGDIRSIADAARMLSETGCQAISIGRGALANPWIFQQLLSWEQTGHSGLPGNFEQRFGLLQRQFDYLVEQKGIERAIVSFRKMGHWYLNAMRVVPRLRNAFQTARTKAELDEVLSEIAQIGPHGGDRTGLLPELKIPVPSGPVERW
jgi:tRNA-dihydrouridine synthase B